VQVALGVLWLADALLQFQPFMFTRGFATQILAPAAAGCPGFVAGPLLLAARLIAHAPVAFNAGFATLQLAIGIGLLWRRTVRAALVASIVWGLAVWWLGEGLGGIFTSDPNPVTGAPGGAVLYALISVLAWPSGGRDRGGGTVAGDGPLGGWASATWLAVWGSGAYFLLLAANQAPRALAAGIAASGAGEPGWLAGLTRGAVAVVGTHGAVVSIGLAEVFAVVAFGVSVPALTRPVLVLAVLTAAVIWVLGEAMGGIFTGQGTDPDTGPLLILLAVTYWPLAPPGRRRAPAARPQAAWADPDSRPGRHRAAGRNATVS
jgi:hypothetical protein